MNNNVPFLNWGFMVRAIPEILKALPMTLNIAIVTMIFSLILSFFIALVRINKIPVLTRLATIYVSFIRGTPLLVQIYLAYYGLPKILDYIHLKYGFNINVSGYLSETFRAAIQSVDKGQVEAALSIGMTKWQAMRRIVLPQAIIITFPNFGNTFISLIKDSSLAFSVSIVEMIGKAKIISASGLDIFEAYIVVSGIYWVVCIIVEKVMGIVEKKLRVGGL